MQLTLHSKNMWLDPQPVGRVADRLWRKGYGFDLVSDRLLADCEMDQEAIQSPGARYRLVLVPAARILPLETLQKLLQLAREGATVAFVSHLPDDVPGLHQVNKRQAKLRELLSSLDWSSTQVKTVRAATVGQGRMLLGPHLESVLTASGVKRETLMDHPGLQFARREHGGGHHYFISNEGERRLDGWVTPAVEFQAAALLDPMTGQAGLAHCRVAAKGLREVYLQLEPGESLILRTLNSSPQSPSWEYRKPRGQPVEIHGNWSVTFIEGGPELPSPFSTESLDSWTILGDDQAERFAGTARYEISFDAVGGGKSYLLRLGKVADSARVRLNDGPVTTLVSRPFQVRLDRLRPTGNRLQIEVTNVAANRIRDLDIREVPWKEIHGYGMLNMGGQVNKDGLRSRNLDASLWDVREAGLFGPVTLQPLQ